CCIGFVASTALFLLATPPNAWPLYLSVPVLIFICAYSYTKRFTALAHVWLGTSLCLAPLAAWIAIRGIDDLLLPALLGLAVLFWVTGFDIIYACQDAEFDRQARLNSIPAAFGTRAALRLAFLCHMAMLAVLIGLYFAATPPLGYVFLAGVGLVALLLLYE